MLRFREVSIATKIANATLVLATFAILTGCEQREELMPVSGHVLYKGKPLEFGGIMFQPSGGRVAYGTIGADGKFQLTTYEEGDGVKPGSSQVRVTCYEAQRPGVPNDGLSLGKRLIPEKYTDFGASGLQREVTQPEEDLVIELE